MNSTSQAGLYFWVVTIMMCTLLAPTRAMASDSVAGDNVVAWEQLSDPEGVRTRALNNQMVLQIFGNRYVVKSPQRDGWMKWASGGEVKSLLGNIEGETTDEKIYLILGVGSSVALPDQWINLFGVRLRNGTISIQKSGLQLNGVDLDK